MAKTATIPTPAPADVFGMAPTVVAPTAKAKASNKAEYQLEGLDMLASLNTLIDTFTSLKKTQEAEVKTRGLDIYCNTASLTHARLP